MPEKKEEVKQSVAELMQEKKNEYARAYDELCRMFGMKLESVTTIRNGVVSNGLEIVVM